MAEISFKRSKSSKQPTNQSNFQYDAMVMSDFDIRIQPSFFVHQYFMRVILQHSNCSILMETAHKLCQERFATKFSFLA